MAGRVTSAYAEGGALLSSGRRPWSEGCFSQPEAEFAGPEAPREEVPD